MTLRLPQAQVLDLAGPDAIAFAHAQFASDLRELAPGAWQWSAWLSPQGRVRALFRLLRVGDDTLRAVLSGGTAEELRHRLSPFVLRSKLRLDAAALDATGCFEEAEARALLGVLPAGGAIAQAPGRIGVPAGGPTPRWLVFGDADDAAGDDAAELARWRIADIDAGIVELSPPLQDRFLPAALGLDRLGAVSVRKGCYPGQEIVSRLHFRGGNKRWLHRLEFVADEPPPPGLVIATGDGAATGELLQSAWTRRPQGVALAVLPGLPAGVELAAASTASGKFRVVSRVLDASD